MTRLNIFKLEDVNEANPVCSLPKGEHQIGRDGILKCSDKRISRSHAIIIITEDAVTLKSVHVNPCFYRASRGKCLELVKKDESVSLSDGDQFSLLADSYWFRVRISSEEASEKVTGSPEKETPATSCLQNISRLLNTSLPTEEHKIDATRLMTDLENIVEADFGETIKETSVGEDSNESMDFADLLTKDTGDNHQCEVVKAPGDDNTLEKADQGEDEKYNCETAEESNTEKEETLSKVVPDTVKTAEANSDNETASAQVVAGASTDIPKVRRDRCWYGANCYRKNPLHRSTISHPGDDDYDSDPTDDKPECPFGTACYRTNKDHRRDYKHSAPPSARKPAADGQSKQSPKPSPKNDESSSESEKSGSDSGKRRKRKAAKKVKKWNETPEDDYDLDDPFLNDASSDDFELSDGDGSDDTTDWEDSQCVDEESQERKRLLKEAKKFTKGKKRKKT